MGRDVFGEMLVQLKITNRLLVAQLRSQMRQNDLVGVLATTGASVKEIAEVLDTTPGTVTTTLARLKKRTAPTARKESKETRLLPGL